MLTTPPLTVRSPLARRKALYGLLERVCEELELTPTQFQSAEEKYHAVGKHLEAGGLIQCYDPDLFAQGSMVLETTVRPYGQNEYDIDLVCLLQSGTRLPSHAHYTKMVGDRLAEDATYKAMLTQRNRCWCLNYAGQFHLDIIPAVPNDRCSRGGGLVADRKLRDWSPTHPRGYVDWFRAIAALIFRMRADTLDEQQEFGSVTSNAAEPLPQPRSDKGLLRRAVQIYKRHRDVFFADRADSEHAPVSIIITTLAALAYQRLVNSKTYETAFDLLLDILEEMPAGITLRQVWKNGRLINCYEILNPTTDERENFADRWNEEPAKRTAFFRWLDAAKRDLHALEGKVGEEVGNHLRQKLGGLEVGRALARLAESVNEARRGSRLYVDRRLGVAATAASGVIVPRNTFYGR